MSGEEVIFICGSFKNDLKAFFASGWKLGTPKLSLWTQKAGHKAPDFGQNMKSSH
jgi:hypothetical protein